MARAGLTPDRVVAEGAAVADDVGWDRLTLAEVAHRLGVRLPSLYKHVGGIEELRQGIARLALEELVARLDVPEAAGDRALMAMAWAYRDYAHAHPGRYAATLRAPEPSDDAWVQAADRLLSVVMTVLAGYGLEGDDAIDATRALRAALHGFVSLESAGGFAMDRDPTTSFTRMVDGLDAAFTTMRSVTA